MIWVYIRLVCLFEFLKTKSWQIAMFIVFSLQSTDEMLVHLQSFSSNPIYYTIPESAKNGVPLFYLPPNSNNPVSTTGDKLVTCCRALFQQHSKGCALRKITRNPKVPNCKIQGPQHKAYVKEGSLSGRPEANVSCLRHPGTLERLGLGCYRWLTFAFGWQGKFSFLI